MSEHPSKGVVATCEKECLHVIKLPIDIVKKKDWPNFARIVFTQTGIQLCSCVDGRLLCMIEWAVIVSHREVLATHKTNMDRLEIEIMGGGDDNAFVFEMQDCSLFPAALTMYSAEHETEGMDDRLKVFSQSVKVFV